MEKGEKLAKKKRWAFLLTKTLSKLLVVIKRDSKDINQLNSNLEIFVSSKSIVENHKTNKKRKTKENLTFKKEFLTLKRVFREQTQRQHQEQQNNTNMKKVQASRVAELWNTMYDIANILTSVATSIAIIYMLVDFHTKERFGFFYLSLVISSLAHVIYCITFVLRYCDTHPGMERIMWFFITLPLSWTVPFVFYLTRDASSKFTQFIANLGLEAASYFVFYNGDRSKQFFVFVFFFPFPSPLPLLFLFESEYIK
ncbi:hypothetical protein RFI_10030 [Reticulomyxa filosa]|uniref:Transmembrane protein n=1 Tax=Reticulomyxa filosa TaxID=46433 RepID=X6NME3_RETFI|nr:hypothetical protein RFI_10030 [Reticulomyxa filosa]|eukprot:ETO27103.1 hypothetical protein RFI_10030 [Reticulomyxa filosa]